jgi:hypothetical protein
VEIELEEEPGSAGVALSQRYVTLLAGYAVHAEKATGNKVYAVHAASRRGPSRPRRPNMTPSGAHFSPASGIGPKASAAMSRPSVRLQ